MGDCSGLADTVNCKVAVLHAEPVPLVRCEAEVENAGDAVPIDALGEKLARLGDGGGERLGERDARLAVARCVPSME